MGQWPDRCRDELCQLVLDECAHMRRIDGDVELVERLTDFLARCDHVGDHHSPLRSTHARHLTEWSFRIREVVQRGPADHEIERIVDEGKLLGVSFLQQHVLDTRGTKAVGTEREQRAGEVDTHHLTHMRRDRIGHVRGAARDVEHDHVGVEGLNPRQRRLRPLGEERFSTREERSLLLERSSHELVMTDRLHAVTVSVPSQCASTDRAIDVVRGSLPSDWLRRL